MAGDLAPWIAIIVAASVTFATRALGPLVVGWIPSTERFQRFLDSLSSSVIVAIVAGYLARGTLREAFALFVGAVAMVVFRRPMLAMSVAILAAAGWTGVTA